MNKIDFNFDEIDWEEVLIKLNAFTLKLTKKFHWSRDNSDSFLKGKEVKDYVNDAIESFLRNPEKFNPAKGDLIKYLCYNIIRTLVGNDARSKENMSTLNISNDEDNSSLYTDLSLPLIETFFDQNIDFSNIMIEIENSLSKDKIAENIFMCERYHGMKRREIILEFNYSDNDYDNGKRRMQTILNNIAQKFQLKSQSI